MASAATLPAARPPPRDLDAADKLALDVEGDADLDRAIAAFDESTMDFADPMVVMSYYRHLLPFRQLFTWLNRASGSAPSRNFTHREFAFTLQNEAYLRYNSFATWEELRKEVLRLNPARFEIGPVYTAKPKDRKTVQKTSFKPVSREFVLDIDMTDYDEIRTCCSGKGICRRCWAFIAVAVEVLDSALRTDFGFRHLLWVYSGRRGIHCWISDEEACALPDDARKAIVGWLEVIKGGASAVKKVDVGSGGTSGRNLHPSLRRALGGEGPGGASGPLKRAFVDIILTDQECFRSPEGYNRLLALLPASEQDSIAKLRSKWDASPSRSSLDKWQDVMDCANRAGELRARTTWRPAMEDIVLQYTYPRIDAEVSKHMNHLLKAPFVVHPGTGRVCVPVDPAKVHAFDPQRDAPTVAQLFKDLNRSRAQEGQGWEKTGLKPFVQMLEKHCKGVADEARLRNRAKGLDQMDF